MIGLEVGKLRVGTDKKTSHPNDLGSYATREQPTSAQGEVGWLARLPLYKHNMRVR